MSGAVALAGAAIMESDLIPDQPYFHLDCWALVVLIGLVLNYGCLAYWFLFSRDVRRDPIMLKPALDALPALGVGAVLTLALALTLHFDLLFGVWMCLYGLAQVAYRQSLPRGIYLVGLAYMICGSYCLLDPSISFIHPWPMGIVFFIGEVAGGLVLLTYKTTGETND